MKKRILVILVALCIGVTGIVSGVLFKVSVIDSKELQWLPISNRVALT